MSEVLLFVPVHPDNAEAARERFTFANTIIAANDLTEGGSLYAVWNQALDHPGPVAIVNDDVVLGERALEQLLDGLGPGVGVSCPVSGERMAGWCFMVRPGLGLRFDEDFRWYYGDADFARRVKRAGWRINQIVVDVQHLGSGSATSELIEWGRTEDAKVFNAKWG